MDDSQVQRLAGHSFTGVAIEHRRLNGARISRIMHPPMQSIAAHSHDWPTLVLCRVGGYEETVDGASVALDGPAVVFQPAGAAHADTIGGSGLETLTMSFDPAWLAAETKAALPSRIIWRLNGAAVAATGALREAWLKSDEREARLQARTSVFLADLFRSKVNAPQPPPWAKPLMAALGDESARTTDLARMLARNPAWLARAYRAWRGEGIAETLRRRRVERAIGRLRASPDSLADIAIDCGFCDQSHMNRAFRAVLGRTPLSVRREALLLQPIAAAHRLPHQVRDAPDRHSA